MGGIQLVEWLGCYKEGSVDIPTLCLFKQLYLLIGSKYQVPAKRVFGFHNDILPEKGLRYMWQENSYRKRTLYYFLLEQIF